MEACKKDNHPDTYSAFRPEPEWYLEMQGKRLTLVCKWRDHQWHMPTSRGPILTFSKRARLRMLKKVAEINWQETRGCLFLTLTYPDERANFTMSDRTDQRNYIHQEIERTIERRVSSCWRVEWMPRLTGEREGILTPHIHMLLFGVTYLSHEWLKKKWQRAIGWNEWLSVDVRRCDAAKAKALYVAKYCAKQLPSGSLDNVPYLNKCGRHAGWRREKEIPRHTKHVAKIHSNDLVKRLRALAAERIPSCDQRYLTGFTALGDVAIDLIDYVKNFAVAGELETLYDAGK